VRRNIKTIGGWYYGSGIDIGVGTIRLSGEAEGISFERQPDPHGPALADSYEDKNS
jgi:hypothetical protein